MFEDCNCGAFVVQADDAAAACCARRVGEDTPVETGVDSDIVEMVELMLISCFF
jgi:hypothetical protein|tara:strand:- start:30 stop:191 length:162 start_codon:yes stop_codon:yes gene_type:complete